MKLTPLFVLMIFIGNLLSLSLIGLTAYMIHLNRPYWGWVLLAALLAGIKPTTEARKA